MSEPVAARPRLTPRRVAIAALLSAAVAIAITFWLSNAGDSQAAPCAPQDAAAQKIDAVAIGQLAALNGTGTGRGYSEMKFTDAAGKPVTLADFAGKTLLVNFWASWCIPCRAEMPALDRLAAAENDADFMVLPINLDLGSGGLDKAKAFLTEGNWANLPLYADSSFEAFKQLQTSAVALGLPSTLLIDRKGCEIGVLQGPAEWDSPDGINVIEALKFAMSGVVLTVGALSLDTIFRFDTLPTTAGKFLPLDTIQVAQGMATAQAATIVRLGGKARLWASIGDDPTGERIAADLAAAGIDISALRRVPGAQSGFSSILMDKHGERIIVPHYDAAIRSRPDLLPLLDDVAVVSVDVRWPDAAEIALHAARDLGVPGILDVEAAPEDVLDRLVPIATHLIASEPGATALTGEPDPARAATALGKLYSGFVAVTAGERGVFWPGGHQPAFPVEAVDTLAAGDVFHGAFAFGLAEGWEIEPTIRFAAAAAAIKCTRFGGRLGAPTRDEVEAFLAS